MKNTTTADATVEEKIGAVNSDGVAEDIDDI